MHSKNTLQIAECVISPVHMERNTHPTQGFAFINEIVTRTLLCAWFVYSGCVALYATYKIYILPTHMVVQRHNTWSSTHEHRD